ncbi:hypothetical protein BCR43DRAFT_15849 [Syncephalastrum racemosum]|uniref:Uncharacterized protein n=1 Tax=Syncephalastrum racemosum TaxID=13706 RepID=A0A1X2HSN8_SYNRA|nr:hypothetical protein BCR43DRAFT_15849 [Syncephalastrum racemosum]
MTTGSALLDQLRDVSKCDDALVETVRQTLLEPFQPQLSASGPTKRQPTQAQFQAMTNRLSPLAIKILQQNTETMKHLKMTRTDSHNYSNVVQCLVDTSTCAIAALRHMKTCSHLRPLDIEKLTSNMICKIVDLEEHARALQEIQKQRVCLARVANIELRPTPPVSKRPNLLIEKSPERHTSNKSPLRETQNHRGGNEPPAPMGSPTASLRAMDIINLPAQQTQWEDDTIRKYGDLFIFPLDTTIVDRSMILLVLSYQMNLLRSWSAINRGALLKHLPRLFDKPGNFIDWCDHLNTIDEKEARAQYDLLYRQFTRSSNKAASAGSHFLSFVLQIFALKASRHLPNSSVKDFCHRLVHISGQYEKTSGSIEYKFIHKTCNELLETVEADAKDQNELEAYCLLCEYTAYAARKVSTYWSYFLILMSLIGWQLLWPIHSI